VSTAIRILAFFILGVLLSAMGYSLMTWQFWAVTALATTIQITTHVSAQR
jgi:hypothetical protein